MATARSRTGRTQAERSEATTHELVRVARELFATRGFAGTSIEDIVESAGVTRGALYHHFDSKTDVFRAVCEGEQAKLAEVGLDAASRAKGGMWKQLEAGSLAFLEACLEPGLQRIVLVDAFAVLGWEGVRASEERHTLAQMRLAVSRAIEDGEIPRRPVEPLVAMLFGGLCEAAMTTARATDQRAMLRDTRREVQRMFAALAQR